ncbi:MAG: hypothetical protein ACTSWY_03460 [Promethearchaeota archaeon]
MAKKKSVKKVASKKKSSKKKTSKPINYYVFDANFFISQKKIRAIKSIERINDVRKELGLKYYISNLVYNEIPFMHSGSRANLFKNTVEIVNVSKDELTRIKKSLSGLGVKEYAQAQDPDLSLIALCKKLVSEDSEVFLVSDDFKLSENVKTLNQKGLEFLSLSAFLLYLSRKTKNPDLKKYFKEIRDKTLSYTLSYMLERHKQYNAQSKLMWLIEKAVSVTEDGSFNITGLNATESTGSAAEEKEHRFKARSIENLEGSDKESEELLRICNNYVQTHNVTSNELEKIALMLPLLDEIIKGRKYITTAKNNLIEDENKNAVDSLHLAKNSLMNVLQKACSILPKEKNDVFTRLVCLEISKCEFLRAFLLIGVDNVDLAIEALNSTAMFSTIAKSTKSVLAINYLKGLIFLFNEILDASIEQFQFTANLANNYMGNELLVLKCSIGRAITLFISGMDSEALELIDKINQDSRGENLENSITVFMELGDYFLAISKAKIAIALYDEALECAVDSKYKWKIGHIMDKLQRAYVNAMFDKNLSESSIDIIIDKVHDLKNIERYNEEIGKLSKFNRMLYEDFPIYTGKGKKIDYFDLNDDLREVFDIVAILESEKSSTTVLISFNKRLGLVGFRVNLSAKLQGLPENYTIKLKKNAKINILKPSAKLKAKYLIRAIIQIDSLDHIDINRNIPIFFSQMNI